MTNCMECKTEFVKIRKHQRFCSDKCRHAYHNREKLGGLPLTPQLREQLRDLAEARNISINEMACEVLHRTLNPDGRPMEDIMGDGK